jgi:TM2 domain-containing membrane protein YozV
MSEEKKGDIFDDFEDKSKSAADSAKEKASQMKEEAKEAFAGAKEKASEMAGEAKEAAKDTINDMKEGWNQTTHNGENKKLIAGILAIVIGSLGIHKFILGYTQEGIIQIVISIVTCGLGGIIGLIEGIIYLTKSDEEFYQTYQVGKKGWF